jgi:hypothetical protein
MPVVLCKHQTWSLTLRKQHRLKVFQNMRVQEDFVSEREEVTGHGREVYNEKLHKLYFTRCYLGDKG